MGVSGFIKATDLNRKLDLYILQVTFGKVWDGFVSRLIPMFFAQFTFLMIFGHTICKGFGQQCMTEFIAQFTLFNVYHVHETRYFVASVHFGFIDSWIN